MKRDEKYILNSFENVISESRNNILKTEQVLSGKLADIFERFQQAKENLKNNLVKIKMTIDYDRNYLASAGKKLRLNYARLFSNIVSLFKSLAEKIALHDPERQLQLGYSLVSLGGKIVRSVKDVGIGDEINVKVSDGEFSSEVKRI